MYTDMLELRYMYVCNEICKQFYISHNNYMNEVSLSCAMQDYTTFHIKVQYRHLVYHHHMFQ